MLERLPATSTSMESTITVWARRFLLYLRLMPRTAEEGEESVSLVEVKKGLARRAIEQIGFIKDINSLVLLSGK
jgi:hypothetical protein